MLSLVLLAYDVAHADEARSANRLREKAVRSLSSLVEGVVSGLIADATLVGPPDMQLGEIADEAGCALVEAAAPAQGLMEAAARARHLELFLLAAGCAVERGFFEEAHDIFAFGAAVRPRALRLAPAGLASRIVPRLAPVVGVIASKAALTAAGLAEPSALARRLRAADLSARARKCL